MSIIDHDYKQALSQAFWRKISRYLTGRCNDLLSFNRVLAHLREQPFTDLGLQNIALERVIGSSGRAQDYDLAFAPLREERDGRWLQIAAAVRQGIELAPIRVYQVDQVYFVDDGNHRVSVARFYNKRHIRAHVISIDPSSLTPEHNCTRLGYKV